MKRDIELNSLALMTRQLFHEDAYSPIDIFALVNNWKDKKITIVYYPLSNRISGMCTWINDNIVICINSTTSYGRQRFTLAHELYHIIYEKDKQRVVCDMSLGQHKNVSEREADKFATYLLIPYDALHQYAEKILTWELSDVIDAEQFFQISHQAMLLRLLLDNYISKEQYDDWKSIGITSEAKKMGYSGELYQNKSENSQFFTTGEYIRKVERLSKEGLISNGKKEELLLDAFRTDIVYNLSEEGMELND